MRGSRPRASIVSLPSPVATLSRYKLQERGGRWLKLVSGVVMLGLAVLLIMRPAWLAG